jgi:hypothetical protein
MTQTRLNTLQAGIQKIPLRALIYGAHGIGKSHFASEFPNPVFLDTEGNVNHLTPPKHRVSSWSEAQVFLQLLLTQSHDFQTLIIDSIDPLEEWGKEPACKLAGTQDISEGYGKGWGQLTGLFQGLRNLLEALNVQKNMHILCISHVKTKRVLELDKPPYDMIMPLLHERVMPIFADWCTFIGYAHKSLVVDKNIDAGFGQIKTVMKEEDTPFGSRVLQVGPSSVHVVKETFNLKKTPENNIPLSAKGLLTQIERFYDTASVTETKEDSVTETKKESERETKGET